MQLIARETGVTDADEEDLLRGASRQSVGVVAQPFRQPLARLGDHQQVGPGPLKELVGLLEAGRHLSRDGIEEVLRVRSDMNDGGNRRYMDEAILAAFENPQRLDARRSSI